MIQGPRRPRFYSYLRLAILLFIVVGLVALSIFGIVFSGLFFSHSNAQATPTTQAIPTLIIDIPQSSLNIILETPPTMQTGRAYIVKISLIPKGAPLITDLRLEGALPSVSQVATTGTPGVTLREAFGPSARTPSGNATLTSGTFDIAPSGPEKQPLDQPKVTWKWSVTPKSPGIQFLSVTINATWMTANGQEEGPYTIGDRTFQVNVTDAFFVIRPVDIGAILTSLPATLLGAGGLGALFILWLVRRRQTTKKKSTASPPLTEQRSRRQHTRQKGKGQKRR